jgi:uncharacterized protein (DUF305 family)
MMARLTLSAGLHLPSLRTIGLVAVAGLIAPAALEAQDPPRTVQPGAPGAPSRVVEAGDDGFQFPTHSDADVMFMQMMIAHHAQALVMSDLVPDRSTSEDVRLLAHRIHLSQFDEIALMAQWLRDRGAAIPEEARIAGVDPAPAGHAGHGGHDAHAGHAGHAGHAADHSGHGEHSDHGDAEEHDHSLMAGMLTEAQLAELAAATGDAFDRLFLEFMIYHHEGAILMVDELFASPLGGQEGEIYNFASHVDSDQRIEIDRMRQMLAARGWN